MPAKINWLTAALWIAINVAGFGLVGTLFHNFPLAFEFPTGVTRLGRFELMPALLGGVLYGAVPALLIGLGQWLVLRQRLAVSGWWILSVAAGMGLQHFLADGFPNARDLSLAVLAASAVTGLLQAPLLGRRYESHRWWAAAAIVGWWLGWLLSIAVLDALGLFGLPWVAGLDVRQHGLQGLLVGAMYSGLTGLILAQPARPAPVQAHAP